MRWCGDRRAGETVPEPGDDVEHVVNVAAILQYEAKAVPAPANMADGWRRY